MCFQLQRLSVRLSDAVLCVFYVYSKIYRLQKLQTNRSANKNPSLTHSVSHCVPCHLPQVIFIRKDADEYSVLLHLYIIY